MFYSHEILTSRKHGVATIWLMATLGSKSGHKKITKRAILDVNLPKACETVTEPEVPLALRLQGSLLIGISRVFNQQCEYMRNDAEGLEANMKKSYRYKDVQHADSTLTVARAKSLNLPDDPAFNVDLDLGLDFAFIDRSIGRSYETSLPTLPEQGTSQSSLRIIERGSRPPMSSPSFDLQISDIVSHNLIGPTEQPSASGPSSDIVHGMSMFEQAIYDDPGMLVNEDGELVFHDDLVNLGPTSMDSYGDGLEATRSLQLGDLALLQETNVNLHEQVDDAFQPFAFDDEDMPPAQTAPSHDDIGSGSIAHGEGILSTVNDTEQTTTADAPLRPTRVGKPAQLDLVTEVGNREMAEWNPNYLDNMLRADRIKASRTSASQAKRNAAFWVVEQGIGGVAVNFDTKPAPHPLAIFSGQPLLDILHVDHTDRKRSRSNSISSDNEPSKRSRVASAVPQLAGQDVLAEQYDDEEGILPIQDDLQLESEMGRRAESSLKDHSSQMPWNLSSRHGSARFHGSAIRRVSSITGSAGGFEVGPPSLRPRRWSRLTSASPLIGKGQPLSRDDSLEGMGHSAMIYDIDEFGDLDNQLAGDLIDSFELYGPAARVSTQQADESQWIAKTLETEGQNFLHFLDSSIKDRAQADDNANGRAAITFESLLPPRYNSEVVAAQALLHVLTLATKGLVEIKQEQDFGDITLTMTQSTTA